MTKTLNSSRCSARFHGATVKKLIGTVFAAVCYLCASASFAANPIVTQVYTADPAARVYNGRVYVMTSHDTDTATDYSTLRDYFLFSSDDMVNWRDHGIVFSATDTSWATNAYAPDHFFHNNKYWLIFPDGASSIGVAVADKPEGPYKDHIGHPLIDKNTPNAKVQWLFDPGVFKDDDGKIYIAFGGGGLGNLRIIRVADDMKRVIGSAVTIDAPHFFEAPYIHKRKGTYYLSYSTNATGGFSIDYLTSSDPMSGYKHRGTVIANPWQNRGNNNHHSFIEFNNQWYGFYHNRAVADKRGKSIYQRSINIDKLEYSADGALQKMIIGPSGVSKVKNLNPFVRVEAEVIAEESGGIETEKSSEGTLSVRYSPNSWIKVVGVDFGGGTSSFQARVASTAKTKLEIILDRLDSTPVGILQVNPTGGIQSWQTKMTVVNIEGIHDVYFRAKGPLNVDWYRFSTNN